MRTVRRKKQKNWKQRDNRITKAPSKPCCGRKKRTRRGKKCGVRETTKMRRVPMDTGEGRGTQRPKGWKLNEKKKNFQSRRRKTTNGRGTENRIKRAGFQKRSTQGPRPKNQGTGGQKEGGRSPLERTSRKRELSSKTAMGKVRSHSENKKQKTHRPRERVRTKNNPKDSAAAPGRARGERESGKHASFGMERKLIGPGRERRSAR